VQPESKRSPHTIALWGFLLLAIIVVLAVLIADASITPEQRVTLFQQSGFFP
jgi:hypothetical protein